MLSQTEAAASHRALCALGAFAMEGYHVSYSDSSRKLAAALRGKERFARLEGAFGRWRVPYCAEFKHMCRACQGLVQESGQHLLAALQTGLLTTRTFGWDLSYAVNVLDRMCREALRIWDMQVWRLCDMILSCIVDWRLHDECLERCETSRLRTRSGHRRMSRQTRRYPWRP